MVKPTVHNAEQQAYALEMKRELLSSIPTIYGRLVLLSSLRDPNSGRYDHFDTGVRLGEDAAHRLLESVHIEAYREWLSMNLEQQRADLMLYLVSVGMDRKQVLRTWIVTAPFRSLIPLRTQPVEQDVYLSDMQTLLDLLMNEYGALGPEGAA